MATEAEDLKAVQDLVSANPILCSFFLHRLGNLIGPIQNYAEMLEMPDTTEAQRQKYVANIKLSSARAFKFLRECNINHEFKRG